jgi:hypothetical protein
VPRVIYNPETEAQIREWVKDYARSGIAPQPLLQIGTTDYTQRLDGANWQVQSGSPAWDLSASLTGNIPAARARNAPCTLAFDFGGIKVDMFHGRGSWPQPDQDNVTTVLAVTPGGWLDKLPLGTAVTYINRTPQWVLRDALTRVAYYNRGMIFIPAFNNPLITRQVDDAFEDAAHPIDIIQAVAGMLNISYYDTPVNFGHVVRLDVGTGDGENVAWAYNAQDDKEVLEKWVEPTPVSPDEQVTEVVVREYFENGTLKVWEKAAVPYFGLDYPPLSGQIQFIDFVSSPDDPIQLPKTQADAHAQAVKEARKYIYLEHTTTQKVAFNPFHLPNDVLTWSSEYEDDTGFYARQWRTVVQGVEHDYAETELATMLDLSCYLLSEDRLPDPPIRLSGILENVVLFDTVRELVAEMEYELVIDDIANWAIDDGDSILLTDDAPMIDESAVSVLITR